MPNYTLWKECLARYGLFYCQFQSNSTAVAFEIIFWLIVKNYCTYFNKRLKSIKTNVTFTHKKNCQVNGINLQYVLQVSSDNESSLEEYISSEDDSEVLIYIKWPYIICLNGTGPGRIQGQRHKCREKRDWQMDQESGTDIKTVTRRRDGKGHQFLTCHLCHCVLLSWQENDFTKVLAKIRFCENVSDILEKELPSVTGIVENAEKRTEILHCHSSSQQTPNLPLQSSPFNLLVCH